MSADIWLGHPHVAMAHFRDSYLNCPLMPAIGLSYWNDINPMLNERSQLPLERNAELAAAIRAGLATFDEPDAEARAAAYIDACGSYGTPDYFISIWRHRAAELLDLLDRSTRHNIPLTMWL